ncbi:hypothetical protein HanXRQr2_Chr08g0349141 [Helianthus annuus]|uniref:Uncharacterized protein n=1 Tax=Helianthus annuus TaxID=4232 RepID=A0A9K3NEA9_HELAN|nr:hypothetical protein HanXRQr2_Chr08g0349141 [Helianthus annuus]KAJ0902471.1 hypothetical protein HanPSC8_Chr08g0337451 [Helianthus annuus]
MPQVVNLNVFQIIILFVNFLNCLIFLFLFSFQSTSFNFNSPCIVFSAVRHALCFTYKDELLCEDQSIIIISFIFWLLLLSLTRRFKNFFRSFFYCYTFSFILCSFSSILLFFFHPQSLSSSDFNIIISCMNIDTKSVFDHGI